MKARRGPAAGAPARRSSSALAAVLAAAAPFALYLRTMAPTVYGVDSAELTTGAYLLGIVHPPGAPGYLLLGHVFTWLPFGDAGYRLNLFSATAAALSLCFLYVVVRRLTDSSLLALATSWFVGSTYYVWVTAVAAEVYSLQGAVVVGLIALALRFRAEGRAGIFYALCLVAGFGLGVHPAVGLILPGVGLLALGPPRERWREGRLLIVGALCGVVGASVYLYLPLRHMADLPLNPARDYWQVDLASWDGFRWMVSGRGFERHFFAASGTSLPRELGGFAYRLWSNFAGLGALLGLVGLVVGLARHPWVHGSLLLMLLGHVGFYLPYGAGDKAMMFLPVYLIWGIWIGLGAAELSQRLGDRSARSGLGAAAIFALAAFTAALNFGFVDISDDRSARERGEAIVASLPANAIFIGDWGDLRLVEYFQFVEGRRHDIDLEDLVFVAPDRRADLIAERVASGRPVYVTRCSGLGNTGLRCEPIEGCDCYRVLRGGAP